MKYFIANWKANKNILQATDWVNEFIKILSNNPLTLQKLQQDEIKIIICPPFPLIFPLKQRLKNFKNIFLGSQDISHFADGTYTGEVTANNLSGLVDYSIIGHSERKKNNFETLETDKKKIINAKKYGIEPIYCVADSTVIIPQDLNFVCLEPPNAISSGDGRGDFLPALKIVEYKKQMHLPKSVNFIYGGSVNKDNIQQFLSQKDIDGFLSGGASLNPIHFYEMISLA